jgi:ATP-dependent RNA helicase SUPV3L1/SUV3
MAKKKRKYLIKLNNKIRNFFDGLPFEEGVVTLSDDRLVEICMLLELEVFQLERDEMIRGLRRAWSEGNYRIREDMVKYLHQLNIPTSVKIEDKPIVDNVDKILMLLDNTPHTKDEENEILDNFINSKRIKITQEKIEAKLSYIRLKSRLSYIESTLEVMFDTSNCMSFYESYKFRMRDIDFTKRLLTSSSPVNFDALWRKKNDEILNILSIEKEMLADEKQSSIDEFILSINDNEHKYLSQEQINNTIKTMPPEVELYHIPINIEIIESILRDINPKYNLFQSSDHFMVEKEKIFILFGKELRYNISISYSKEIIYYNIWSGTDLPIALDFHSVNGNIVDHFNSKIDDLYEEMRDMSSGLNLDSSIIDEFILRFIEPSVASSRNLKVKDKSVRGILYHFWEHIKPIREKKMREELLAKSIRDFKNLFPIARALKREIIFHLGETNSGKTYSALESLKKAETGYYLAPLRLLALEGYENLKKDGVAISLITGEEEIIDEESTHISSTIEMLNNSIDVDVCVIDEIQMIDDRDRGWAWANALIGAPAKKVILTGSSNALEAVKLLCEYLEEPLEVIEFTRKNPLKILDTPIPLDKIEKQTAVVAFSRRDVLSLKQQLSTKHSVSVIYGNLSPEVRREEARRFREGISSVLVSTDAIAMGLNLPIKTLLFSKDNKFDGLRRRELLTSEILQISGRAGRYGIEEVGFVGALDKKSLDTIRREFHKPLDNIELPLSIMASLEQVLLIGEILEIDNIMEILEFFADNMEFDGPFVAGNIDSMLEIAQIVDGYELDLKTKYFLTCAPASISSPYIESVFNRYIKNIESGDNVLYIPPRDLPVFAQTNDMLLNAEDRVREISLYLWLSFKFPDKFMDTQKAIDSRVRLNQFIENSLKKGHFVKKCRKCSKVLDFSYRFSICDSCFRKGKRGDRSYRSHRGHR